MYDWNKLVCFAVRISDRTNSVVEICNTDVWH